MSSTYGIERPGPHAGGTHRAPARFLVIIESGGSVVARLFLAGREPAGEFDAGTEEVAQMTRGLEPAHGATAAEWDQALAGHSAAERAAAQVYSLDV